MDTSMNFVKITQLNHIGHELCLLQACPATSNNTSKAS